MTQKWDYLVSDEKYEDLIRNYCTDFTANAKAGRYGPITGRDKEIDDCILVLLQKGRKNVCFLAPAGVGKTAAVVGLAQKVAAGTVPDYLKNARVIEVDLARMASGTSSRAEFQDRFLPLCKAVSERYHNPENPRTVLFLDEIHQIMPNCIGSSYAGLSDTMKPYLTAGDLLVIGATTLDEFRMYVATDPALDRRFQKVFLKIPNVQETFSIMKALRPGFEKHHRIKVSDENLLLVVELTEEHMRRRNQPDKSIITMDSAMAYHAMYQGINQDLTRDSIYYMVARETGLNKTAMHDEKLLEKIREDMAVMEGQKEAAKPAQAAKLFDPAAGLKNVEFDAEFQKELERERSKVQAEIDTSTNTKEEKEVMSRDLNERIEQKLSDHKQHMRQLRE